VRTAFTELFGIEHPIASAGMARVAQSPLVAAVSEAGGLGCLGGVSYLPDALREEIRAIRRATHRPFAVNLLVPPALVDPEALGGPTSRSGGRPFRRPTGSGYAAWRPC
jgi:NAD(P)H-dependent flavin oxidoreductase YrpB (nitropropane dioxygenase family)